MKELLATCAIALVVIVSLFVLVDVATRHLPLKAYRLPSGEVVQCRAAWTYKSSCAHLEYCVDGRDRCVTSYEIVGEGGR